MPIGSSKIGFVKNAQYGVGGTGVPVDSGMTLTLTYSGNSTIGVDANSLTLAMDSEFANTTVGYIIEGNIAGSDFSDGLVSGNVTLDANGNGTITKNIVETTGTGHRDFIISIIRPGSNVVIANTDTQYIYEVVGDTITGGDTTTTTVIEAGSHRVHKFTTVGDANLNISSLGNESGNTNVWNKYFRTDSSNSYFDSSVVGTAFRATVIGAGGQWGSVGGRRGAGAGELGLLKYPRANISTGVYTITVGGATSGVSGAPANPDANSTIFGNDLTLKKVALGGGGAANVGVNGGSGQGFADERLATANTNLAITGGTFGSNFTDFVIIASGSSGDGYRPNYTRNGGGGAFGIGGYANANVAYNAYGAQVSNGQGSGFLAEEHGGHGARFAANATATGDNAGSPNSGNASDYLTWKYNPLYDTANAFVCCGGGSARPNYETDSVSPSIGEFGPGGGGFRGTNSTDNPYSLTQDGLVSFSYPYANTRFVTGTVIS